MPGLVERARQPEISQSPVFYAVIPQHGIDKDGNIVPYTGTKPPELKDHGSIGKIEGPTTMVCVFGCGLSGRFEAPKRPLPIVPI